MESSNDSLDFFFDFPECSTPSDFQSCSTDHQPLTESADVKLKIHQLLTSCDHHDEETDQFEEILLNGMLLMMNAEDLKNVIEKIEKIIKSDKRRIQTLGMIINWAKIDFTTRKFSLSAVLKNLSLHKLLKETFITKVGEENIIKDSHPCSKFLCETICDINSDKPSKKMKLSWNAKLYCFGGEDSYGKLHTTVSHMDIDTGRWSKSIIRMPPRNEFAGAVIGSKIYLCGGVDEKNRLNTMEVFDSATNTWMELAPMPEVRYGCAAAALDSFIYVSGGRVGENQEISRSVIRFDVENNKWESVEDMLERRCEHALVQCNNRLYAVGCGEDEWLFNIQSLNMHMKLMEIYDPIINRWEYIKISPPMECSSYKDFFQMINFSATTCSVHDDKIFIFNEGKFRLIALHIVKEAESILVFTEDKFIENKELIKDCVDPLSFPTSVSINDTIWTISCNNLNEDYEEDITGVYSYDLSSDEWTRKPDMDIRRLLNYRSFAISTEKSEKLIKKSFRSNSEHLYCFGGKNESEQYIWSISHMDVSIGEWDSFRGKCSPKTNFCGAVIGTKIYLCGGHTEDKARTHPFRTLDTMEVFDCLTNTWTELCPMPEPRHSCAAAVLNGYIYVAGGWNSDYLDSSHKMFRYNVQANEWKKMKAMLNGRYCHQLVASNDRLYAIGGIQDDHICGNIEEYNPTTDKWTLICDFNVENSESSTIVHNNEIYMYYSYKFVVYSPDLNHTWRELTPIENSETYETMNLLLVNGQIWAVGGYDNKESIVTSIFSYDLETNKWSQLQDMDILRRGHCSFVVKL